MAQDIVIGGRLHSAATGNTVAGANEILDDAKGKKQNVINQEVDNEIGSDSEAGTIKGRIKSLETAVGSGGSVDERIAETKAEIIGDAAADYNTLGKVEDKIKEEVSRAEGAEEALDAAKANKATTLEGYGITDAYTKSETYNKTEVNGLVDTPHQNYVTVLTYAALIAIDPGSTDTIYRVSNYDGSVPQVDVTKYSEYAWDGTQYVFLCVKSQIDEVFDISVYNNNATYADLAAAIGTDGANVPQTLRRGGMSVKFVHSVDNKYVQYRYMGTSTVVDDFTNVNNWQGVANELILGSHNLAESGSVKKEFITLENEVEIIKDKTSNISSINEEADSVVLTDKNGHVGWKITPKLTNEDGIYYTDKNGNIIQQIKDGKQKMANLETEGSVSEHNLIVRANKTLRDVNAIKNEMDNNMPALLQLADGSTQIQKTTSIPSAQVKNGKVIRLRLHYGASKYTPDDKDIFFEGNCKTDFSDVRFFDGNGNILKASFGKAFNIEPYRDARLGDNQDIILVDSNGYIIRPYSGGVGISKNNAESFTLIPNTANVTEHGSDVYGRKGIYPLMLDDNDNIFGYAGGKLYKLLASDDYATITEVLNFSWVNDNNETVYPDVQNHGMAKDINGNIYIGAYAQTQYYHVEIFVSTDGGNTFIRKYFTDYSLTGTQQQHVHHIHADKYSSKVYVGIDGGTAPQGPVVIVTSDAGNNWTDITTQLKSQRGHDYYPTYFGTDYKLGGGENYTLGGNSVVRGNSTDDKLDIVKKGYGGVRSFADFGNDNTIIAGVQRCQFYSENQIIVSHDKGKSWKTISRFDTEIFNSSGDGLRDAIYTDVPIAGESEPCVIINAGQFIKARRIYQGGNHHYREVEILVENAISEQDFTIVAKTGYAIPYPYKSVRDFGIKPFYSVKFDEGCGAYIQDSIGTIAKADNIEWDIEEEPVRKGEYGTDDTYRPFDFSSAAKIKGGVNFGIIPELDFSHSYTISFWCNEKNRKCNYTESQRYERSYLMDDTIHILASFGNVDLFRYNNQIGIKLRNNPLGIGNYILTGFVNNVLECSDNYYHCVVVVNSDNTINLYINATGKTSSTSNPWSGYKNVKLSEADFVIGSSDTEPIGFISDFRIYDRVLTNAEVLNIYKGFNY